EPRPWREAHSSLPESKIQNPKSKIGPRALESGIDDDVDGRAVCMENADLIVRMEPMDLKSLQKPLKEKYRADPSASWITLKASGSQSAAPVACSVDIGRAVYEAQAHAGVGGPGTAACSGDLLLGALAACAQITCQMVAAAMGVPVERIEVTVEGDLD